MSGNQTKPPRKNVDMRVQPPTDLYVDHPFSLWRLLSYPMALLLLLLTVGGAFWGVTSFHRASIRPPLTTIIPTPVATIPSLPNSCLDQPPLPVDQKPALFFCSPKFQGNVSGPFGTHIVLVGENFPSLPTTWLLHVNPFKDNIAPVDCKKTMKNDCLILPPPASQTQISHNVFWVSWTWQNPFPNTPDNYFISAQIKNKVFTPDLNFTLLSKDPPCITISTVVSEQAQPPDCAVTPAPIVFSKNATVDIQGKNWLLGWNNLPVPVPVPTDMTIHVLATCAIPSTCSQPLLFHLVINSNELSADGTFFRRISLADQAINPRGRYRVSAWNEIPAQIMPGGKYNTIANNALGFGENSDDLVLKIV